MQQWQVESMITSSSTFPPHSFIQSYYLKKKQNKNRMSLKYRWKKNLSAFQFQMWHIMMKQCPIQHWHHTVGKPCKQNTTFILTVFNKRQGRQKNIGSLQKVQTYPNYSNISVQLKIPGNVHILLSKYEKMK